MTAEQREDKAVEREPRTGNRPGKPTETDARTPRAREADRDRHTPDPQGSGPGKPETNAESGKGRESAGKRDERAREHDIARRQMPIQR